MPIKVLVFESDPAFAGELRTELDALGCSTLVVDDGNVGLQQATAERPDLILLSIELPRMNGFSVCNKLKKDPSLKDVPLIIMSTESSDETFEQHKKLRTRAEDYVHKPFAFGELLQRIRRFVPLALEHVDSDGAIVIEDEIEVGSSDYLLEEDRPGAEAPTATRLSARPPPAGSRDPAVEAEVDAFAESAFGRLTGGHDASPALANGLSLEMTASAGVGRGSRPPAGARTSARPLPPLVGVDPAEYERLKSELAAARERYDTIERELEDSRREVDKLRIEAGDAARLAREADDLRGKLAASARTGGISSRDFLDLREALNKKDKELLAFREQLSKKDREIVEAQDRTLGLERGRADLEERLLGLERELAEAKDQADSQAAERELAKRANDDLRARLDRAKAENDARERQLSELRARQADERAANEVRLASVRAELDQVVANERAEHARALDQAELRRRNDVDQVRRERDTALAELRDQAEHERAESLAIQAQELRLDHDSKLAASQRIFQADLERMRAESAQREQAAVDALRAEHAETRSRLDDENRARLMSIEAQAARERDDAQERNGRLEADLADTRSHLRDLSERKQADDARSEARIAELERILGERETARAAADGLLTTAHERVAVLENELRAVRGTLADAQQRLEHEVSRGERARAKWEADRQSLERAKDALAVALLQIEDAESRPQP